MFPDATARSPQAAPDDEGGVPRPDLTHPDRSRFALAGAALSTGLLGATAAVIVAALFGIAGGALDGLWWAITGGLTGFVGWRCRHASAPVPGLHWASGLVGLAVALDAAVDQRWAAGAVGIVAVLGVGIAGVVVGRKAAPHAPHIDDARRLVAPGTAALMILVGVWSSVWSVVRHQRFGSGSWDYGCYVHNAWLFASGEAFSTTATSSVLGDVAFWGGTNHFMPTLVLTAPIGWLVGLTGQTALLAVAQVVVVVVAAVPLAGLATRMGVGPRLSLAIVGAYLLHVGVQAALFFDVHEIAPVPALLLTSLWLVAGPVSPRRRWVVFGLALLLAGTKESSWLYAAGLGAVMLAFPGWRREGVAILLLGAVGFVVVIGLIQPALLEPGSSGMIHAARFVALDGGSGLLSTVRGILLHPGQAVVALVSPVEKAAAITTSTSGFGALPWFSPLGLVLGAPNVAERFFADKREMWGLAFHYGLVTAGWLAFAAVDAARRMHLNRSPRLDTAAAVTVVCIAALSQVSAPRPPDLWRLEQPYFADSATIKTYQRALATVPADAAVVAQNHLLPHLAYREHIWQPEERFVDRADVVILDTAGSAWPHTPAHVRRLVARLRRDPRFSTSFHEGTTWVFRRRPISPST